MDRVQGAPGRVNICMPGQRRTRGPATTYQDAERRGEDDAGYMHPRQRGKRKEQDDTDYDDVKQTGTAEHGRAWLVRLRHDL
jgi:hypothetical protein